ncbi:MAG: hypothetical protein KKD28_01900, partial [Chloroflexi bacterium]|nr:hypothetical protein [Chloroflexota bacterium]
MRRSRDFHIPPLRDFETCPECVEGSRLHCWLNRELLLVYPNLQSPISNLQPPTSNLQPPISN